MQRAWLITGISSGLGRSLAEKVLARGDRVAGTARTTNALSELKSRYGDSLWVSALDVTDTAAIRNTVNRAFADLGRIDVIVSNAGYGLFGAAEELTDEQIRRQIDTNLIGSIQLIRAVMPKLRAQGGGRILQMSSEGGQIAYPSFSVYHASKWGIEGFVESVSQEVAPFGIEFTIVEPGPTRTNFGRAIVSPEPMAVYENTPAGEIRRTLTRGTFEVKGDPEKMALAMLECVDRKPAPKRLALGSNTYPSIRKALSERLTELEAQKAITVSMDVD